MDQQKIIHLVGETVIVGGLFLYLQRQIKSLQNEVTEIKETMIKQQEFIDKNFVAISKTIDFLASKNKLSQPSIRSSRPSSDVISSLNSRLNKQKLNAVPIPDDEEQDNQLNELMFPPTTGTIFVQTFDSQTLPNISLRQNSQQSSVADIVVMEEEQLNNLPKDNSTSLDDINDIDDISEELKQLQSSQEAFSISVESEDDNVSQSSSNENKTSTQPIQDKKSKSKKGNLKTKK